MNRVAETRWVMIVLMMGFVTMVVAPGLVQASAGYTHMTTRSGDFYVLISRLDGDDSWDYVDGVYRFRRAVMGDDGSYTRCLLGVENDPITGIATADMGDVGYSYGLSVDKFNQVYFLEDQSGGWKQLFSRDGSGNPVFHQGEPNSVIVTYTPWNCNPGDESWSLVSEQPFNAGKLYIVRADGTEGWYDDGYLTDPQETGGTRYKPDGEAQTYQPAIFGGTGAWAAAPTPRYFSNAPDSANLYPFVGSSDPRDVILPRPVNVIVPYDQYSYHQGGMLSSGKQYYPFPTHGNNVSIPFGYWYISDEEVNNHPSYPDRGFMAKRLDEYSFIATRMHLTRYLDHPDYETLFGVANGGHRQTDGSALYIAVGEQWSYEQTANCGDFCMNEPRTASGMSPPARAGIVFSTYGNSVDEQRIYGVRTYGDLTPTGSGPTDPSGRSELLRFTRNSVTGDWDSEVIYPHPTNPKPHWVKLLNDPVEGWSDGWESGFASDQFRSVGIASATTSYEWVYLSTKDPDKFTVSDSFFRMGGTLWTLDSDTGNVAWQERNELSGATQQGLRNVGEPDQVTDIAADGQNYVYVLVTDKDPVDDDILFNNELIRGGTETNRFTDSAYYVQTLQDSDGVVTLLFKQEVGKRVLKGGFMGPMNDVGFAPKGNNYWTRCYRYQATGEHPVGWVQDTYTPYGSDVDETVRSEIAAVNIAMPPAQGSVFLDIMVFENSGDAMPIVRPQDRAAFPEGNTLRIEADVDGPAGLGPYANYVFNIENLPRYGTLLREPYGYMVANFSAQDIDQDGRGGSFVYGLIWPSEVSDSGAGSTVHADRESYELRYAWRIRDVTQYEDGDHQAAGDFNEEAMTDEYLRWDGVDEGFMSGLEWRDGALDDGHVWYLAEEAPAPSQPIVVRGITMPEFRNPGRYEIVFKMKGGYWDIPVLDDFNEPIIPEPEVFSAETKFVVEIKAQEPEGDHYVYDLEVISGETGASVEGYMAIDEGDRSSIYTRGIIRWFGGENYDDSSSPMTKTSGAGSWNYTWNYGGRVYPNNWDFSDPQIWPNGADLTIRNDGDGPWGTRYSYDPANPGAADMLPVPGGDYHQRIHDWFGIKYMWELTYLREHVEDGLTTAVPVHVDYRWGNLAELYVMQKSSNFSNLQDSLLGGEPFIEVIDAARREYMFRIPLMDAAGPMANLFDSSQLDGSYAPWLPNYAALRPQLGFDQLLRQPRWFVPTEPTFMQLTCHVWYPRVEWVPARDPQAPDPTDPSAVLLSDQTGTSDLPVPLYYTLVDDPCPVDVPGRLEFLEVACDDNAPAGTTVSLWPGRYKNTGGTEPRLDDADGTNRNVFTMGDDGDDYYELMVRSTSRPHIYGSEGFSLDEAPPLNPADGTQYADALGSYGGQLGKTIREDVFVQVRDNNPYVHWQDHRRVTIAENNPHLTNFLVETGDDPRNKNWGVGLTAPNNYGGNDPSFGFDISARSDGDFKDAGRDDWPGIASGRSEPTPSGAEWRVPGDSFEEVGADRLPGASADDIVGFDKTSGGGDSPFPVFEGGTSSFESPVAGDPYAWNVEANRLQNWRTTVHRRDRRYLPLPIFTQGLYMGDDDVVFGLFGKGRAQVYEDGMVVDERITDGDTDKADEQYTRFADITVRDRMPPHVSVEVRVGGSGERLFFLGYNDYARNFGLSPGDDLDESNYLIARRSGDTREIVAALSQVISGVTTEAFAEDWTLTSHSITEGDGADDQLVQSRIDFTTAQVLSESLPQPFQPAPMDPERFTVHVEENAQITLVVRACDNSTAPSDLRINVTGGEQSNTNLSPFPSINRTNVIDRLAILTASHNYPRQDQEDEVTITVEDEAGNSRQMVIRFVTHPHNIDFRIISDRIRRVR